MLQRTFYVSLLEERGRTALRAESPSPGRGEPMGADPRTDTSDLAVVDRLIRLRQAHAALAAELGTLQRKLVQRERELRELRAELDRARSSAHGVLDDT